MSAFCRKIPVRKEMSMRQFIYINIISSYFGLLFFLEIQLFGNIYRIARITGWEQGFTNILILIINICLIFLFAAFYIYFYSSKHLFLSVIVYISCITWFIYFYIINYIFNYFFAIVRPEEQMSAGAGFIAMIATFMYPFYILIVILIGRTLGNRTPWRRG